MTMAKPAKTEAAATVNAPIETVVAEEAAIAATPHAIYAFEYIR